MDEKKWRDADVDKKLTEGNYMKFRRKQAQNNLKLHTR